MEKDKKVTALYCRLSKDDGSAHESLSIRTQKAMLMEYATRNGFGNCQYYVDDGYSGTNSDRPAFQELLDDIRDGKVATVITKDQSRLGRKPTLKDTIQVLTEAQPLVAEDAEMSALVQQTIPKMQRLTEPQFKGLELEWYKPEEPNKKTGVAEK